MDTTPAPQSSQRRQHRGASRSAMLLRTGIGLVVTFVVCIFAAQSWLESYLKSESFRVRAETTIGKTFHANAQLSLPQRSSNSLYVDSFAATGIKADPSQPDAVDARFRSIHLEGVRGELDLMAILNRVWRVESLSIQRADLDLNPPPTDPAPRTASVEVFTPSSTHRQSSTQNWISGLLPNTTEIRSIKAERADISKMGTALRRTRLTLRHVEKDWEVLAEDGELSFEALPLSKPIELKSAQLSIKKHLTVLKQAHLILASGGQAKATGQWESSGDSDLHADLENINIEPFISKWWQPRLLGSVDGNISLKKNTGKPQQLDASLRLKGGRLESLPLLSELDAFLGTPRFRTLAIRNGSAKVHREGQVTEVKDIELDADGVLRLEGALTIRDGKLDGTLQLGISPSLVQWLPSSRNKIFEENRSGYLWTPVHISGTTDLPQEDLSKRLLQTAAGVVIDSLQNIQKNPQKAPEALKGVLDAVKSILPGR
jgi:hypothetical protein